MECLTGACNETIEIETDDKWKSNQYCSFVKASCPSCLMKYWVVQRGNKSTLQDRTTEEFDMRISDLR